MRNMILILVIMDGMFEAYPEATKILISLFHVWAEAYLHQCTKTFYVHRIMARMQMKVLASKMKNIISSRRNQLVCALTRPAACKDCHNLFQLLHFKNIEKSFIDERPIN